MEDKTQKIPVPQQKSFNYPLSVAPSDIDKEINKWLEKKVIEDKITPFGLSVSLSESEIVYIYSYTKWVESK